MADLLPLFAVEDAIEERLGLTGEILSSLREHRPDALILVGGEEAGSFQSTPALAGALTTVHACHPGGLPTVLLAGPAAVRERMVADLRQRVRRGPDSVPPVQQTEPGDLSDHLKRLWQEKWASHPAWRAFANGGDSPPMPRLTSIGRACQELSRTRESPIWAIEVGDADVVAWRATPERVDLVRRSIGQLAPQRNDGELDEWLGRPWLAEIDRPSIERQRDLTSRAIAEVAGELRGLGRSEPRPGLVVGRGVGLIHRLPAADAVIAICLGIGLTGPTPVALDRHGLLAGAGLLLERHRDVGVDLIRDALDELGVAIIGRSVESDGARVQIEGSSKHGKAPSDVRVGEVSVLSSLEWTNSEIALNPSRTVDVGYGEGRHGQISLGESEVGAVLTISTERAPRRWTRVQGGATGLAALLRRST